VADRVVKYVFRGDISGLKSSLTAAGAGVKDLGNKLTAAGKDGDKFRTGLTSVGGAAGKVGLVAAAGLGAMVAATANFDKAMSGVKAATHETAANMELMRAAAIKAGADTAFSASEAADGIEQLAKAGVATKDILGGGLDGALSLAAAGSMEVGDAAEVAATALTQFKLQGKDIPHVADLLAAAAGKAQGEVSDMGMALKQGGLVAAQMGLSIEETTGTLAAFASAGLLGSDAGTSLKTMLLKLANPSSQAAGLMQQLGINAYDASGNLVSMSNLAGQLQTAFKGQSQATRDAAMATIFGSDAIRASSILYSQGSKGITDWTNKVNDQGFAAETAALKLDNLSGDLEKLKGSLETALIGSGEGSQGMLRGLVQGADSLVNAFNNLPGPAKNVATAFTAITAVTGGGLWFSAKAIGGIANMRQALADLGPRAPRQPPRSAEWAWRPAGSLRCRVRRAGRVRDRRLLPQRLPGRRALTKSLLELQATGAGGDLATKYADIGDSIRYLGDPNLAENIQSTILKVISLGTASDSFEVKQAKREIDSLDARLRQPRHQRQPRPRRRRARQVRRLDEPLRRPAQGTAWPDAAVPRGTGGRGQRGGSGWRQGGRRGGGRRWPDWRMAAATTESYTLKNAMDILFGKVDVDAALVSWQRGIQGLGKGLKGGAHALDVMTTKGQDNRDKIRGQVEALRTWAEAQYDVDGSTKGLTAASSRAARRSSARARLPASPVVRCSTTCTRSALPRSRSVPTSRSSAPRRRRARSTAWSSSSTTSTGCARPRRWTPATWRPLTSPECAPAWRRCTTRPSSSAPSTPSHGWARSGRRPAVRSTAPARRPPTASPRTCRTASTSSRPPRSTSTAPRCSTGSTRWRSQTVARSAVRLGRFRQRQDRGVARPRAGALLREGTERHRQGQADRHQAADRGAGAAEGADRSPHRPRRRAQQWRQRLRRPSPEADPGAVRPRGGHVRQGCAPRVRALEKALGHTTKRLNGLEREAEKVARRTTARRSSSTTCAPRPTTSARPLPARSTMTRSAVARPG
jgi:TP901 family phage tail tape measure protein